MIQKVSKFNKIIELIIKFVSYSFLFLFSDQVMDSSGVPKPGFVYGNNYWFGIQSQCKDMNNRDPLILIEKEIMNNSKYRHVEDEFPPYEVKYFVAYFKHNSTLQYHVRLPNEVSTC